MDLVLGVGLMAATALFYAFGFAAHRRDVPSKWTRFPGLSMLYAVTLTLLGPIALGFIVKAALNPLAQWQTLHLWQIVPLAGLVALAFIGTPLMLAKVRRDGDAPVAVNSNRAPQQAEVVTAA